MMKRKNELKWEGKGKEGEGGREKEGRGGGKERREGERGWGKQKGELLK